MDVFGCFVHRPMPVTLAGAAGRVMWRLLPPELRFGGGGSAWQPRPGLAGHPWGFLLGKLENFLLFS